MNTLDMLLLAKENPNHDPATGQFSSGEGGGVGRNADDIHAKLKAGLFAYDSKQAHKPGYNPYAFSHYQDAAQQIHDEVAAGKHPRQAILEHFNDRLTDVALRSIGEPKSTLDERRQHGH